jgi:DNA-binding response OmpR family regulator
VSADTPPATFLRETDLEPLSVLLVDDEPDVLASLCAYLRQIGWSAEGASTGDDAERLLVAGFRTDVAVVDFRLHQETGVDVITRLRGRRAGLPAVIVTGDTSEQRLREFARLHVSVLHKPIDGERLAVALRAAVDTRSRVPHQH